MNSLTASGVTATGPAEATGHPVELDHLDVHHLDLAPAAGIKTIELTRSSVAIKRAIDFMGALVGLVALSPFMLTMAVAVKLDTRGPVFFRQRRVGRHGAHFEIVKIRTMVHDAESLKTSLSARNQAREGLFKIGDDPRVTRVGKFLRKTSLDELPQLFNVLRGDMSLVGPRPLILEEDSLLLGWRRRRLDLLPGMTGPWQMLGPTRASLSEMAVIDYRYVANWSLWTDIKILFKTTTHVLGRRGL
jgi:lipopolysaccharide/colanic/teichoic acid biosynthesis glycosyltransferase